MRRLGTCEFAPVCHRYGLLTKHERLLRLEKATAVRKIGLSEEQTRLLERKRSGEAVQAVAG